jgi:transcriptional repressor NrdR
VLSIAPERKAFKPGDIVNRQGDRSLKCPYCSYEDSKVLESRFIRDSTRRRRECLSCKKRFTTYERIENVALTVTKKDGRKEQFDRNKIRSGLLKACEKRNISGEEIEKAVSEIEQELRSEADTAVTTKRIGELVMKKLKKMDKVAYIRFASVYKDFGDISDFTQEVKKLIQKKK